MQISHSQLLGGRDSGVLDITPAIARAILDTHTHPGNRDIRQAHLVALGEDMKMGRWKATHQGIAIGKSGLMLDGHHRCGASVKFGVSFRSWVFLNVDDESFEAIDMGHANRSVRDVMSMREYQKTGQKLDSKMIEPLSYLAYILHGSKSKPALHAVEALYRAFGRDVAELNAAIGTANVRGRTTASLKAALALRLYAASSAHREYLLAQWRAFVMLDFDEADTTTKAMIRRMDSVGVTGGQAITERAAIGWIGFGADRNQAKVTVRPIGVVVAEMRVLIMAALERELPVALAEAAE